MPMPSLVVKVGGSLYDWPDLATRLQRWLKSCGDAALVLVPGGGPTVDAIRHLDVRYHLGEEKAHWLALRALTLNAFFLADLWPGARVVQSLNECTKPSEGVSILDAYAFARWDEIVNPGDCLPHSWEATSDSLAGRVAVVAQAARLCLLKSTMVPDDRDWTEPRFGFVDALFRDVIGHSWRGRVEAINFRAQNRGEPAA